MTAAATVDLSFAEEAGPNRFNASACMSCGVCTALCPVGIDILPRKLFRYAVLGLRDELLAHTDTIFQCLLCRMCEDNCTADVHIVDNIRYLRTFINREVFGLERGNRVSPGCLERGEPHAASHA